MFNPITIKKPSQWALLGILICVLAGALYYFVVNFEFLKHAGYIRVRARHMVVGQVIKPEQIRSWMTFRYINLIFGLPPEYLQTLLGVTDKRYPNVSVGSLAKQQGVSPALLLQKITQAINSLYP